MSCLKNCEFKHLCRYNENKVSYFSKCEGEASIIQGRIQVWLRGGGEFQLAELMYILGENKIRIWWDLFKANYQGKVAMDLNPEEDIRGEGGRGICNTHQIVIFTKIHIHTPSLYIF